MSKSTAIENRVLIAFLKPISTEGLKADEIARRWTASMNSAITSMNNIIRELNHINTVEKIENAKVKLLSNKRGRGGGIENAPLEFIANEKSLRNAAGYYIHEMLENPSEDITEKITDDTVYRHRYCGNKY